MTDDGTGAGDNKSWFEGASADQQAYITQKGWKGPLDVVGTAMNAEKLIGAEKAGRTFVLPKDDNDAEGIKAFRSKIGVPEKADGYVVADELKDDPMIPVAREAALEAGIPAGSFGKFVETMMKHARAEAQKSQEKYQADTAAELESLKTEWGKDFDERSEFARRFVKAIGWDDKKIALFEKTFGTATMLKDFYAYGSRTAEHGFKSGDDKSGGMSEAGAAAARQIAELKQRRLENKIGEKEYFAELDRLAAIRDSTSKVAA